VIQVFNRYPQEPSIQPLPLFPAPPVSSNPRRDRCGLDAGPRRDTPHRGPVWLNCAASSAHWSMLSALASWRISAPV